MMTRCSIGAGCKIAAVLMMLAVVSGCGRKAEQGPERGTLPAGSVAQINEFMQAKISTDWDETTVAGKGTPVQVLLRVGPSTDPNVCTTGEMYGPFTVTDNSVDGSQSTAVSQPTLRLANQGDLAVCLIITSPVNANLNVEADALYLDTEACDQAPANIAGTWEGNYSCTSSCGGEAGFVSLTIQQDGYNATYVDDGAASYEGTVCGNLFQFSGGGPGYTESGRFTLNGDSTASKTSTYQDTGDSCSGTCSDPVLVRQ